MIATGNILILGIVFNTGAAAYTLGTAPGTGSITFNSSGTPSPNITINSGVTNNQTINANLLNGGNTSFVNNSTTATLSIAGNVALTAAVGASRTETVRGAGNTLISGSVSNGTNVSGFTLSLIKSETGTLTLSNNNSYTGITTINGGVLEAAVLASGSSNSSIGASSNAAASLVFGAPAATLRYTGSSNVTIDRGFTLSSGAGGGATIESSGTGTLSIDNTVALAYGTSSGSAGTQTRLLTLGGTYVGANTFSKVIANNSGTSNLTSVTKAGVGTWVLSGANTFTGATTIGTSAAGAPLITSATANGGTLDSTSNNALGSTSSITVNNGGTLLLTGATTTGGTPGGISNRVNNSAGVSLGTGGATTGSIGGTIAISGASPVLEGTAISKSGVTTTNSAYATASATSVAGFGALTLTSNSTLDFGSSTIGTMVFTNFIDPSNAFKLNIIGYTNTTTNGTTISGVDGTDDRLVFNSDMSSFIAAGDFTFNGSAVGVSQIALDSGFYEVTMTAVPEPATWAGGILLLAATVWTQRRPIRGLCGALRYSRGWTPTFGVKSV
ncbi:MAG: autotransporter-associated beta strand repeat-containing protein [Chthoniobacterales bacterium]